MKSDVVSAIAYVIVAEGRFDETVIPHLLTGRAFQGAVGRP